MQRDWYQYVEHRLNEWADWFSRCNENSLGYPRASLLARWREGWSISTKGSGSKTLPTHQKAEEIERLFVEMFQHNTKMALILRAHYFTQGSLREKAKQFEVSHTCFCAYVSLAKEWLVGRLSGKT